MSRRWYIIYGVALVILPLLFFFVARLESPTEIMSPPGLEGQNAQIEEAFRASLKDPTDAVLRYPTSGSYQTAFVLDDMDSDGELEAIVFYALKSDESTVRINILDYRDDKWQSVYDDLGYGTEVVSIEFADFNADDKKEVVICWSLYTADSSKIMTVHSVDNKKGTLTGLTTIVNQSYSFMSIADMDSDNQNEIFVTWLDNTDASRQKSYAALLKMKEDGTMAQIGKNVVLDGSVSSYASLTLQKFDTGRVVAYLDAYKGENSMITEVLWWDEAKGELVAPLLDAETLTNTLTLRSPAVPSMDIDGDGEIEIPTNKVINTADANTENSDTKLEITTWSRISPNGLIPKQYSFINSVVGYAFKIPTGLKDSLVAHKQTNLGVTTVYLIGDESELLEPLFTLSVKKKDQMTKDDTYTFKIERDEYVIFGTLTSAGEQAGFTNNIIENSVIFFSKTF